MGEKGFIKVWFHCDGRMIVAPFGNPQCVQECLRDQVETWFRKHELNGISIRFEVLKDNHKNKMVEPSSLPN